MSRRRAGGLKAHSIFWIPPSAHSWGEGMPPRAHLWLKGWAPMSRCPHLPWVIVSPEWRPERGTAEGGPAGLSRGLAQQKPTESSGATAQCPCCFHFTRLDRSRKAGACVRENGQGPGRRARPSSRTGAGGQLTTSFSGCPCPTDAAGLPGLQRPLASPARPVGRGLAGPGGRGRHAPPPMTRERSCDISGQVRACASRASWSWRGVTRSLLQMGSVA